MPNLLFLIFINIMIHNSLPSLSDTENKYSNCLAPFQCGTTDHVNLSYPFWGSTRPSYCGHPRFQLDCTGEAALLSVMSTTYRVIKINYTSQTLRVARTDYWNDLCPTQPVNSTLDSTLFNYTTNTDTLILFYDCAKPMVAGSPPPNIPIFTNQFSCPNMSGSVNFCEVKSGINSSSTAGFWWCYTSVILRVIDSAAETIRNGSNSRPESLVSAVKNGFGLNWNLGKATCEKCELSGGVCGSDSSSSTGEFNCHCKTGSFSSTCQKAGLPSKSRSTN